MVIAKDSLCGNAVDAACYHILEDENQDVLTSHCSHSQRNRGNVVVQCLHSCHSAAYHM
jgi:hypothetical protein